MELTQSFVALPCEFVPLFTAPSFVSFLRLMTDWVLSHRRRFVTDLIWSSGSTRKGHHSRYHRFGEVEGVGLADLLSAVSQSAGSDQRQRQESGAQTTQRQDGRTN